MRLRAVPVGEQAVLVQCVDEAHVRAAYARVREEVPDARDVVPAATTVLVDGVPEPHALAARIGTWTVRPLAAAAGACVEVPVHYDGPDLADVAAHWGVDVDEAVRLHQEREYVVAFCGFAPGFAYCSGLPPSLAVPRLETPRTAVPVGAVAVADRWTAIYPSASPGGWRLIGRTDLPLWRADRRPPALLPPGTRVRFVGVDPR